MEDQSDQSTDKLLKWDQIADVIVIGSGFAGLAAAIEAKSAGASVVILEKMKGYGGNSVISDGMIAAAGTSMQIEAGIQDTPERMQKDMLKAGMGLNHPHLVQTLTENSHSVIEWTINDLGVKYLEQVSQLGGHSVPRSLTTYNRSGAAIVKPLRAKVKDLGVEINFQAYLRKIHRQKDGRVVGVSASRGYVYPEATSGALQNIKATKAVILASGGFANDIDFRMVQDPRLNLEVDSTNKVCTTGEALKEALTIGAAPVHLSWIQLGPWTSPDEKGCGVGPDFTDYTVFPYGLLVNPNTGKRFVNELADRKIRSDAILEIGQPCIGIADAAGIEQSGVSIERGLQKNVVKKFDQLESLASAYNLDFEALSRTIEKYNRSVENGRDEEFRKPISANARPLHRAPYFGVRVWPKVHHTMGGVQINRKAQVMDLNHRPIKGLYAAGEVTGGVHGACRLGSCAIIDCLVFGRIAGQNAAAE